MVEAAVRSGWIPFRGYRTWYEVHGPASTEVPALVLLHGGPGWTHHHLQNLAELAGDGMQVVLYDQLGCGQSDRPEDPSLWTVDLFVAELAALREALGLTDIHLLGHSWGGSLAVEYLLTKPTGVHRLILSSPLLDTALWVSEADKLKDLLPAATAESMRRHEAEGTCDSEEYLQNSAEFARHFLCRLTPYPAMLERADEQSGHQVYETMWGTSEAFATGTLREWSVFDRLGELDLPTLLISGRYDEATPRQIGLAQERIPGSEWVLLENSSHTANVEEPEYYLAAVRAFLQAD
jgi:proline-specific peptidase